MKPCSESMPDHSRMKIRSMRYGVLSLSSLKNRSGLRIGSLDAADVRMGWSEVVAPGPHSVRWTTRATDSGRAPTADGQNTATATWVPGVEGFKLLAAHRHAVEGPAKLTNQGVTLGEPLPHSLICSAIDG